MLLQSPSTILLVLSLFIMVGCNPTPTASSNAPVVKITHTAGDQLDPGHSFVGLPANAGDILRGTKEDVIALVLGLSIPPGRKVPIEIIGAAKLEYQQGHRWAVLAQPVDTALTTIVVASMDEFAMEYSAVKWQIEQYLMHYQGRSGVRAVVWEDRDFVEKHLLD